MANRSTYDKLFTEYTTRASDQPKYEQALKDEYARKMNENKDLITEQNALQGEIQALPAQERARYYESAIRNPLAQEALIASGRANVTSRLGTTTDLLKGRETSFQDILGKYLNQYNQDTETKRLSAENAWRTYQDQLAQEEARKARAAQYAALNAGRQTAQPSEKTATIKVVDTVVPSGGALKKYIDEGYYIQDPITGQFRKLSEMGLSGVQGWDPASGFKQAYATDTGIKLSYNQGLGAPFGKGAFTGLKSAGF